MYQPYPMQGYPAQQPQQPQAQPPVAPKSKIQVSRPTGETVEIKPAATVTTHSTPAPHPVAAPTITPSPLPPQPAFAQHPHHPYFPVQPIYPGYAYPMAHGQPIAQHPHQPQHAPQHQSQPAPAPAATQPPRTSKIVVSRPTVVVSAPPAPAAAPAPSSSSSSSSQTSAVSTPQATPANGHAVEIAPAAVDNKVEEEKKDKTPEVSAPAVAESAPVIAAVPEEVKQVVVPEPVKQEEPAPAPAPVAAIEPIKKEEPIAAVAPVKEEPVAVAPVAPVVEKVVEPTPIAKASDDVQVIDESEDGLDDSGDVSWDQRDEEALLVVKPPPSQRVTYDRSFLLSFKQKCVEPDEQMKEKLREFAHQTRPPPSPSPTHSPHYPQPSPGKGPRNRKNASGGVHHGDRNDPPPPRGPKGGRQPPPSFREPPPKKVFSDIEKLSRDIISLLNKFTWDKREKITEKLKVLLTNIGSNDEYMNKFVDLLFDKIVTEPKFCDLYTLLCVDLHNHASSLKIRFRSKIVNKAQSEFETKIDTTQWDSLGEMERFEAETKTRKRMLGNMEFIGELVKKDMVKAELIIKDCVTPLVQRVDDPDTYQIESVCKLLQTLGSNLETTFGVKFLNEIFDNLAILKTSNKLDSRIRFMLMDLIDLRSNKWKSRIVQEKATTLKEAHQTFEKAKSSASSSSSSSVPLVEGIGGGRGGKGGYGKGKRGGKGGSSFFNSGSSSAASSAPPSSSSSPSTPLSNSGEWVQAGSKKSRGGGGGGAAQKTSTVSYVTKSGFNAFNALAQAEASNQAFEKSKSKSTPASSSSSPSPRGSPADDEDEVVDLNAEDEDALDLDGVIESFLEFRDPEEAIEAIPTLKDRKSLIIQKFLISSSRVLKDPKLILMIFEPLFLKQKFFSLDDFSTGLKDALTELKESGADEAKLRLYADFVAKLTQSVKVSLGFLDNATLNNSAQFAELIFTFLIESLEKIVPSQSAELLLRGNIEPLDFFNTEAQKNAFVQKIINAFPNPISRFPHYQFYTELRAEPSANESYPAFLAFADKWIRDNRIQDTDNIIPVISTIVKSIVAKTITTARKPEAIEAEATNFALAKDILAYLIQSDTSSINAALDAISYQVGRVQKEKKVLIRWVTYFTENNLAPVAKVNSWASSRSINLSL